MMFYLSESEVLKSLGSGENGLSAGNATARLKNGRNELPQHGKNSWILTYLAQFKDLMVILLIAAAAVSALAAFFEGNGDGLVDTFIIVFIIFLNATVGFVQQFKADRALERLKKISASECTVLRDGKPIKIDASLLVKGDVILLEEGDVVPADLRLIECEGLLTDESALTGESVRSTKRLGTLAKNTALGDRKNCCFSSTFVVKGRGRGVVFATGTDTEIGKIAKLIGGKEDLTPLQKQLVGLGKVISLTVIAVAVIIFATNLFFGESLLKNFMSAVAIAVAAVPEGMPAVVTIIMAMGMQKMATAGAVVRKLHVVETLGSCTAICSDKTGTLTQNRMSVVRVEAKSEAAVLMRKCMLACNTVTVGKKGLLGDPTEVALVEYASAGGKFTPQRVQSILPFDSDRKMMSVQSDGTTFCKGAPDVIIKKCKYIFDGNLREITPNDQKNVVRTLENMSADALRVLGFAYKNGEFCEEELVFLGLVGMIDPPKPEAKRAVELCKRARIRAVMITGDHKNTALAIAKGLDIATREDEVITGDELERLSDERLRSVIKKYSVFARVSPHHKLRIVEALKSVGEVVAMTGDGINDAPAIKRADVGISMGSGTDVTKNASDMVVADDNFATIVVAVKEGRRIFANIKKTVNFFLATNLAEVVCIFVTGVFLRSAKFLGSSQLLWINLITDSFPVVAMGVEKAEKNVMDLPPQSASKSMFSRSALLSVLYYGLVQTAITCAVFFITLSRSDNLTASTMAFFTMSFLELMHAFNVRSEQSVTKNGFFGNKVLTFTVIGAIILNVAMGYVPFVADAFAIKPLSLGEWAVIAVASLSIIPFGEAYKFVLAKKRSAILLSGSGLSSSKNRKQAKNKNSLKKLSARSTLIDN